jgi:hypothetical protein
MEEAKNEAIALQGTFKYLPISISEIKNKMEELNYGTASGKIAFDAWARSMQAVDIDMARHKDQILGIMEAVAKFLGLTGKMSDETKPASAAIEAMMRDMAAAISKGTKDEYEAVRDAAQLAYQARLESIKKEDATDAEKSAARIMAARELAAALLVVAHKMRDDEASLTQEMLAAATEGTNKNKAILLKQAKDEGDFYNAISEAVKKCEAEQEKAYDTRQAANAKLYAQAATLGRSGLALELANIKLEEAAAVAELQRKAVATGTSYAKEISLSKAYYAELAKLAKRDNTLAVINAAWTAIGQVATAVLSAISSANSTAYANMQKQADDYFKDQQDKLAAVNTKQLSDLDIWYAAQKKAIDDSTLDATAKADKQTQLDVDYAAKKAAIDKKTADDKAKLDKEQAAKNLEIKKEAFESQKKIDVANAVMGVANAIIAAAQTVPFIPFGLIAMAAAAAVGALQIATIENTAMPLAKGAAFTKETEFYTSGGGHYVAGEEGIELMVGGREIRSILRQELGGERNRGARPILHIHNYFGGKEIDKRIIDTAQLGLDTNQIMVHRRNND